MIDYPIHADKVPTVTAEKIQSGRESQVLSVGLLFKSINGIAFEPNIEIYIIIRIRIPKGSHTHTKLNNVGGLIQFLRTL